MYSFAQRSDTLVVDEPFYAYYLSKTKITHPGEEEVLKAQSLDEEQIINDLFRQHDMPVLFIKNMAHHIEILENYFLSRCVNIFLIRDPKQIIASYAQVIKKPVMRDIGIEYEYTLFKEMESNNPIVVDSGLLLENPKAVLQQICDRAGIKFEKEMLRWPLGPKAYDGVWAPHWYKNVHRSTGFEKQAISDKSLPNHLHGLYEQSSVYYKKLFQYAIKP